jgi:hypothetical protein
MKTIAINIADAGILNFFIVSPTRAEARHVRDKLYTPQKYSVYLLLLFLS